MAIKRNDVYSLKALCWGETTTADQIFYDFRLTDTGNYIRVCPEMAGVGEDGALPPLSQEILVLGVKKTFFRSQG